MLKLLPSCSLALSTSKAKYENSPSILLIRMTDSSSESFSSKILEILKSILFAIKLELFSSPFSEK